MNATRRTIRIAARRGVSLFEIVVATVLLGAVMTVSVQLLGWAAATRESAERRQWAVQEVANLMERLASRPWSELTPEAAAAESISDSARAMLRDAELKIAVTEPASEPAAKRVAIELRWRNRAGEFDSPVRLTTWICRPAEVKS